jgi:RNA polymerase subunit RPABC4/transcription elongation factor Spt4
MKQCPHCQSINSTAARFCAGCGAELTRQCNACGRQVPPDARFCPHCGTPITTQPPNTWPERHFSPEVRLALYSLTRSLGITFLLLAAVTGLLTPPPRIWDDLFLLAIGGGLVLVSRIFKISGESGPPGGNRPRANRPFSPGGYEIIPADERIEAEPEADPPNLPPPGSTQGPYLN